MKNPKRDELRLPAFQVRQGPRRLLYCFSIDGKQIPIFARMVRLKRNSSGMVVGYQRPEVSSHVEEIRRFLDAPDPMIPNAIVLAFDKRVRFEPSAPQFAAPSYSRAGTLVIPLAPECPEEEKPAFVVDGQQRLAAVRDAQLRSFPVCVTAFMAGDLAEQTSQFLLVNSTKPVAKGIIYELLPTTNVRLPQFLARRKVPSTLLRELNARRDSPLFGRIKTPTNPDGVIKDNSILKMLEHSLNEGALYKCRRAKDVDVKRSLDLLYAFWGAVAATFPKDWAATPKRTRLTHGVGIVSLGLLMDSICSLKDGAITQRYFAERLEALKEDCRWSSGSWELDDGRKIRWDDAENTHSDIKSIADHLRRLDETATHRPKRGRRSA